MKGIRRIFLYAMFCRSLIVLAQGPGELCPVVSQTDALTPFRSVADFEVYLPSAADPVHYSVDMLSYVPEQPDSLAPCDYLIRWKLFAPGDDSSAADPRATGFSAYFDGSHYRMRDGDSRLQEYHVGWDESPFCVPGRGVSGGVQCNAQFTELLPQFIAQTFREMQNDTSYVFSVAPDTIVDRERSVVVKGVQRTNGYDWKEFEYVFDYDTHFPVRIETVTAPGAISEQIISVKYSYPGPSDETDILIPIDEKKLISLFPSVFSGMRQSNFRIENLRGQPLAGFSLPTLIGERYTYDRGSGFASPTLVVFLEPTVGDASATVAAVRDGVGQLPFGTDILWVFLSGSPDDVEGIVGSQGVVGEYVLMRGKALGRDCGVTATPTILFVGRDGIVKEVQIGFNKEMPSVVIEKTIICN